MRTIHLALSASLIFAACGEKKSEDEAGDGGPATGQTQQAGGSTPQQVAALTACADSKPADDGRPPAAVRYPGIGQRYPKTATHYDENDEIEYVETYTYDASNEVVEESRADADGELLRVQTYEGDVTTTVEYGPSGEATTTVETATVTLDGAGRVVEREIVTEVDGEETELMRYVYAYDVQGRRILEEWYQDEELQTRETIDWDSRQITREDFDTLGDEDVTNTRVTTYDELYTVFDSPYGGIALTETETASNFGLGPPTSMTSTCSTIDGVITCESVTVDTESGDTIETMTTKYADVAVRMNDESYRTKLRYQQSGTTKSGITGEEREERSTQVYNQCGRLLSSESKWSEDGEESTIFGYTATYDETAVNELETSVTSGAFVSRTVYEY